MPRPAEIAEDRAECRYDRAFRQARGTAMIDLVLRSQGFRVDARGPDRFAPFVADEVGRPAAVIEAGNITAG